MKAGEPRIWIVVIGAVSLGFMLAFAFPTGGGKEPAKKTACMSDLKQTSRALLVYESDFDGALPPRKIWMDAAEPYVQDSRYAYHCPVAWTEKEGSYGYTLNSRLTATKKLADPSKVAFLFDSIDLRRNSSGGLGLLPKPGRHLGFDNIAFSDGHAKAWEPSTPLPLP